MDGGLGGDGEDDSSGEVEEVRFAHVEITMISCALSPQMAESATSEERMS